MGERPVVDASGDSADPLRWARARDLFHAALALEPQARAAFVESACGSDDALRREVRSLLTSDLKAGDFIERPAAAVLARTTSQAFTPRLAPGSTLGRYEILECLGAGGISQVYRARDTHLGRSVALKLVTDPDDVEAGPRLLAEAQHASILNHPNICRVHEAENDHDLPFIILELVEGPTLSRVLRERRPSTQEALQWGNEIAAALDHAHRRGVIHRDLKSNNVALSPDGTVKILDFGLSRRVDATAGTSSSPAAILADASVAGTLTHIAPETLRGEPVDHRVDLWALGVMLYEMASGRLPFSGATAFQTSDAILQAPPPPLPPSVPPVLQRLILRCLAKDRDARFSTAAELLAALQECDRTSSERVTSRRRGVSAAVVVLATLGVWYGAGLLRPPDRLAPVVAVLPFENMAGDAGEQFYADGMTEALIGALGRIDGVRVIAPGASTEQRASNSVRRAAALSAGANRLLQGSVARDAVGVRLTAQLLDASSSIVIWSDVYQRTAREVMSLHTEVAQAVARAVEIELSSEDARRFAAVRAVDPDVYEAYLKGRYHWNRRTPDSLRTAVGYYEAALKLDPTYAPAYAALADCYNQFGTNMVGGGPPRIWRPKAAEAAVKALQIDPNLAEAHATLAYVRHYDWQWEEAEHSFRRAISLNPNNPLAHIWYANFLCSRLRLDEAVREVTIARELDPLSLIVNTNVGWVLYYARQTGAAIEQFKRTLALDPSYQQAQSRLATAYLDIGRYDEAIALSTAIAEATGARVGSLVSVEQAKLKAGRPNDLERLLDTTVTRPGAGYLSAGAIAEYYFALGHRDDDGFRWLQESYNERTNNMAYLAVSPTYDRVRSDSRFKALVKAVGLP
jgi:serine/threonine-protein kinase